MIPIDLQQSVERGITATDLPILTDDVFAAFRLPIPLNLMTKVCELAPRDSRVSTRGDWFIIFKPDMRKGEG
jgi:hypothetical protein